MVSISPDKLYECIAYFEEPEPGVPEGCSGWYHSYGRFPLRSPEQVFARSESPSVSPVRPEVAGPFLAREDALANLQEALSRS